MTGAPTATVRNTDTGTLPGGVEPERITDRRGSGAGSQGPVSASQLPHMVDMTIDPVTHEAGAFFRSATSS